MQVSKDNVPNLDKKNGQMGRKNENFLRKMFYGLYQSKFRHKFTDFDGVIRF